MTKPKIVKVSKGGKSMTLTGYVKEDEYYQIIKDDVTGIITLKPVKVEV